MAQTMLCGAHTGDRGRSERDGLTDRADGQGVRRRGDRRRRVTDGQADGQEVRQRRIGRRMVRDRKSDRQTNELDLEYIG